MRRRVLTKMDARDEERPGWRLPTSDLYLSGSGVLSCHAHAADLAVFTGPHLYEQFASWCMFCAHVRIPVRLAVRANASVYISCLSFRQALHVIVHAGSHVALPPPPDFQAPPPLFARFLPGFCGLL